MPLEKIHLKKYQSYDGIPCRLYLSTDKELRPAVRIHASHDFNRLGYLFVFFLLTLVGVTGVRANGTGPQIDCWQVLDSEWPDPRHF